MGPAEDEPVGRRALAPDPLTRNLFFTGKGGVGKTSIACATALELADAGQRVLLVSTDPASNLDEALGCSLGTRPTDVEGVEGLAAMNLDPRAAAAAYRERLVEPYRALLPAAVLAGLEEQLSGSCAMEIAAFDELSRLLADPDATKGLDHVLFDTAPTGHTLRLLSLPSAWSGFLESSTTGASCLGPLSGLSARRRLYGQTVAALQDPALTTLMLVARPEPAALREAARTSEELAALGMTQQRLVINALFRARDALDPLAVSLEARGASALADMPEPLRRLPRVLVPFQGAGAIGLKALRALGGALGEPSPGEVTERVEAPLPPGLDALLDGLAAPGHGVILAMGKGGVGKTTIAAAIALGLAARGHRVHLTTTDPAAHLDATLDGASSIRLSVGRIDPVLETARYTAEVLETAGAGLDEAARALLAEDLRSPCTEEVAVFRALAVAVAGAHDSFVVLDTAPTGHTLLLLDAALAYHRELSRQSAGTPEFVERLLPRLRDPSWTRVLIVTLPEATPVHEAAQLQQDLRRAGIEPYAWIINQSLIPLEVVDPLLERRRRGELPWVRVVEEQHAERLALVALRGESPIGSDSLRALLEPTRSSPLCPLGASSRHRP